MVGGQFGVKRGGQDAPLSQEGGVLPVICQDFDFRSNPMNNRCADEHHLERGRAERAARFLRDVALPLSPVAVPFDRDVQKTQRPLSRRRGLLRKQDGSSAGSVKRAAFLVERLDRLHQGLSDHELEHGRALAAGKDEPGEPRQLARMPDQTRLDS